MAERPTPAPLAETPILATLVAPVERAPTEDWPLDDPTTESLVGESNSQVPPVARPGLVRRGLGFVGWLIRGSFCIASLIVLLAFLTAIPIVQLVAFGYLLNVAGRLTAGAKLRDALPHLSQAGLIGMAAVAVFLAALPTQLLVHWESVASLINPGSPACPLKVQKTTNQGKSTSRVYSSSSVSPRTARWCLPGSH